METITSTGISRGNTGIGRKPKIPNKYTFYIKRNVMYIFIIWFSTSGIMHFVIYTDRTKMLLNNTTVRYLQGQIGSTATLAAFRMVDIFSAYKKRMNINDMS